MNLIETFKRLPLWGKVAVIGGGAAGLYFVFRPRPEPEEPAYPITYEALTPGPPAAEPGVPETVPYPVPYPWPPEFYGPGPAVTPEPVYPERPQVTVDGWQVPEKTTELEEDIATILATESITFPPGVKYKPGQIQVMAKWAREEQKAIAAGYAGTSKVIFDAKGLVQRFLPSGQVQFIPRERWLEEMGARRRRRYEKYVKKMRKKFSREGLELGKLVKRKVSGEEYRVPKGTRKTWKPGEAVLKSEYEKQKKAWGKLEELKQKGYTYEQIKWDPKKGEYVVKS